jgi:hypothetical protein
MEQKMKRESRSIVCPDWKEKAVVLCEWDILSEEGRILKQSLKQIDCCSPRLTEFGGTDCSWRCEKTIAREEMTRSGMEWLLVCAVLVGGILWILFYDMYLRPSLHLYGLFLLFGLPFLISLLFYYTWKMWGSILRNKADQSRPHGVSRVCP